MNDPLLAVDDLRVLFHTPLGDVHALRGVSFALARGRVLGLVGESGCGKTVTGRAIVGLVPAPGEIVGGRILFEGNDLLKLSERELRQIRGRRISMIFQDPSAALNPVFPIGQQIAEIMRQHKVATSKGDLREKALALLSDVGLPSPDEILDSYPHQLSGGMQQRAMIAMALSSRPDLLIADEPTTSLDVTIQAQILDLLIELQLQTAISVILVTHNMGIVAEACHEVAVLYAGCIVEFGSTRELFRHPSHPYTQGLLKAMPLPGNRRHSLKVIPGSVPSGLRPSPGCAFASRCDSVMEVCRQFPPPMVAVADGHRVACYLWATSSNGRENA